MSHFVLANNNENFNMCLVVIIELETEIKKANSILTQSDMKNKPKIRLIFIGVKGARNLLIVSSSFFLLPKNKII